MTRFHYLKRRLGYIMPLSRWWSDALGLWKQRAQWHLVVCRNSNSSINQNLCRLCPIICLSAQTEPDAECCLFWKSVSVDFVTFVISSLYWSFFPSVERKNSVQIFSRWMEISLSTVMLFIWGLFYIFGTQTLVSGWKSNICRCLIHLSEGKVKLQCASVGLALL